MKTQIIVAACVGLSGVTCQLAAADEVVITHRSGKLQIITIDAADDPVDQVSFRRKDAAVPVDVQDVNQTKKQTEPEKKSEPGLPKLKLKWAPPVDTK